MMQFLTNLNVSSFFFLNSAVDKAVWGNALIIFCADYLAYLLPMALIVLATSSKMSKLKQLSVICMALLSGAVSRGIVTVLIRFFYYHPRPFDVYQVRQLIPESGSSFPSGHAMFFFAFAAAVYFYNKSWGVWFFLATALMCMARVMAGVHFPLDILGGMVLAIAIAYVIDRYARTSVEHYLSRLVR